MQSHFGYLVLLVGAILLSILAASAYFRNFQKLAKLENSEDDTSNDTNDASVQLSKVYYGGSSIVLFLLIFHFLSENSTVNVLLLPCILWLICATCYRIQNLPVLSQSGKSKRRSLGLWAFGYLYLYVSALSMTLFAYFMLTNNNQQHGWKSNSKTYLKISGCLFVTSFIWFCGLLLYDMYLSRKGVGKEVELLPAEMGVVV